MLLFDIEHYFALHIGLTFKSLLGIMHLVFVIAGLTREFSADRVFLVQYLVLLLSHLYLTLGVLVDLKEFDLLSFNIVFHLNHRIQVKCTFELRPHELDFFLETILFALACHEFFGFVAHEKLCLSFGVHPIPSLLLNSVQLYFHLTDNLEKFRLEFVIYLDDSTSF